MNFTSESFKKTFVRSINAELKKLGNSEVSGDYIKRRIMNGYDNHLFSCFDFDKNGITFDIILDDSANVVHLSSDTIWLFNGYYITHSSNKNTGEVCFTLRKLGEKVWNNFWHNRLVGIRYQGFTIFFAKDAKYNSFKVAQKGNVSDFDNYVCFDVSDNLYANLRPSELKLECVIDNSYNNYGLKLEISITRPELDALIYAVPSQPTSNEFFASLIKAAFCRIITHGNAGIRSSIYYYKV